MIVGIGVDVCDVARFAAMCERRPGIVERILCPHERLADGRPRRAESLAARFAAKEALAKALGAPPGLAWHDAEVIVDDMGRPHFELRGTVAARAVALGVTRVHLSLSHDAGVSLAYAIAEGR
ncbi:holo-[acyl-carrier protein] synthase [Propionibacterium cyclohexanicum]|uniref:Holo-[acyl-carrier-protein] synthase n=1 Tax=Propionibacterium cyclohexanicum TaxID=64702 RepID=A0A1H9S6U7_9ACTN|nr:holo-ACP synthase [Propionibacterium cyclohexanicum]SER80752.1 holo-[acyl-carrier protein] synthase [Propionibacterium cyclohexanicum]